MALLDAQEVGVNGFFCGNRSRHRRISCHQSVNLGLHHLLRRMNAVKMRKLILTSCTSRFPTCIVCSKTEASRISAVYVSYFASRTVSASRMPNLPSSCVLSSCWVASIMWVFTKSSSSATSSTRSLNCCQELTIWRLMAYFEVVSRQFCFYDVVESIGLSFNLDDFVFEFLL